MSLGSKLLVQTIDLADIIFSYCDDKTLFTLSMTCGKLHVYLNCEKTDSRAVKKGYLVRILKFKYKEAAQRLTAIQRHLAISQPARDS